MALLPVYQLLPSIDSSEPASQCQPHHQTTHPEAHLYAGAPFTSFRYVQSVHPQHQLKPANLIGKYAKSAEMFLKMPAPHVPQVAAVRPSAELYEPALHENPWQVVDGGTLLNEVGQQSVQAVAPVPPEYLPAEQKLHSLDPAAANDPASQAVQARLDCTPVPVWNVPAWQSRQVLARLAPTAVENVPAQQAVQVPLSCSAVPVWNVPAWQSWQVLERLAPRAVENVPATQAMQAPLVLTPVLD